MKAGTLIVRGGMSGVGCTASRSRMCGWGNDDGRANESRQGSGRKARTQSPDSGSRDKNTVCECTS